MGEQMLESFGIDAVAEAVYMAMLEDQEAGPAELAARVGIPECDVRKTLDTLAELSLVRPSWDDPPILRPVSPDVGLDALLARQQSELMRREQQIREGRAVMATIIADFAGSRPNAGHPDVEELLGLDAVRERLAELTEQTAFEVLSFMPDGAHTAEALDASRPLDQALLDRGVDVRSVFLDSVRNDPPTAAYARWLTESGGQCRTVPVLPLRMIIVDRREAVVPLNPDRSSAGAVLLRGPGMVAALCALFDQTWEAAAVLGVTPKRDDQGLTAQEKSVLRLLAQGDTDESAARKLGVSARTVGRLTADLMAQLGARSRFQAGVRAAERGWLTPTATQPTPTAQSTHEGC
jgi:DNA-binding CsgD family transcriptional regulator/sugar-specific transcriptional regulator TrmB